MALESIQKGRGKAKVALHKLLGGLRTIYSCEVEDEVCLLAILFQLLRFRVDVVLKNLGDGNVAIGAILAIGNGAEQCT